MNTNESLAWINGSRDRSLDTADRGLAYGDGLFETMRFEKGEVALFELHKQRLLEGCRVLAIAGVESELQNALVPVLDYLRAQPNLSQAYRVKLIVTRGVGGQGFRTDPAIASPTVIVRVMPLEDSAYNTLGVGLWLCRWRLALMPLLAGIKHLNRLEYVMAAQELNGEDESMQGLLTDSNGSVVEALHHNVFVVKRGELLTPKIAMCGVKGVMRRYILDTLAPGLGLSVSEKELRLDDLLAAEEIFLSNSVHGIWPVTEFRERKLQPGAITRQLQAALAKQWRGQDAG